MWHVASNTEIGTFASGKTHAHAANKLKATPGTSDTTSGTGTRKSKANEGRTDEARMDIGGQRAEQGWAVRDDSRAQPPEKQNARNCSWPMASWMAGPTVHRAYMLNPRWAKLRWLIADPTI